MDVYLKVKNKHLSLEAKVIKFEEEKQKKLGNYSLVNSLCNHRKHQVRNENRATYLARAYMKGVLYSSVEKKRKPEKECHFRYYVLKSVLRMLQTYHNRKTTMEDIELWLNPRS